jgi:predicted transcriptional regulator of viral defense system
VKVTGRVTFVSQTNDLLYQLAERQAGYFTTAQAAEVGVSRRTLAGRARRGDIERVRYGIYRLRRFPAHPFEDVAAACLWAGADSAASHETALAIHGISDAMPASIHITVPRLFRGRQTGVVIHRASLSVEERVRRDGVPVTTMTRTLRDVATTSDPALVRQAIDQSVRRGILSHRQLRKLVQDSPEIGPVVVDVLRGET